MDTTSLLFLKMLDTNEILLVLSLVEPDILKQFEFTDHELDINKNML